MVQIIAGAMAKDNPRSESRVAIFGAVDDTGYCCVIGYLYGDSLLRQVCLLLALQVPLSRLLPTMLFRCAGTSGYDKRIRAQPAWKMVPGRKGVERIIANLDKVKLKLDEAFFYLDEIEELIEEDDLEKEPAERVSQANERLLTELSALTRKVGELHSILQALREQGDADTC